MNPDELGGALDALPPRVKKVLDVADELGWTQGRVSLTVRLSKPNGPRPDKCPGCGTATLVNGRAICQACRIVGRTPPPVDYTDYEGLPFFATWELDGTTDTGKPRWHFMGAQAANGQRLNYNDIFEYLDDPTVIEPEPPEET